MYLVSIWNNQLEKVKFCCTLLVEFFKIGTFNIEMLYMLIIHRVLWEGNSLKSGKGVDISIKMANSSLAYSPSKIKILNYVSVFIILF